MHKCASPLLPESPAICAYNAGVSGSNPSPPTKRIPRAEDVFCHWRDANRLNAVRNPTKSNSDGIQQIHHSGIPDSADARTTAAPSVPSTPAMMTMMTTTTSATASMAGSCATVLAATTRYRSYSSSPTTKQQSAGSRRRFRVALVRATTGPAFPREVGTTTRSTTAV
jgi:hypothetical protein